LRAQRGRLSSKSETAKAIDYMLRRWTSFTLFLKHGPVGLSNNAAERAIRPLALTRKNALFAGSDRGGGHWAIIASLVETCKLCGVEPQTYLADVLTRIVTGHLNTRIDDLLPWAYAATPDFKAVA
jgi:hypothetical protein